MKLISVIYVLVVCFQTSSTIVLAYLQIPQSMTGAICGGIGAYGSAIYIFFHSFKEDEQ